MEGMSRRNGPEPLDARAYSLPTLKAVIVRVFDEPGALAEFALAMATAGINIDAVDVTTRGHVRSRG